jgi:hypothetical protein
MSTESQLCEKLRKIEALFAGAGTAGERLAAEAALERVRARLGELSRQDPSIEMQFSMPDQWSRHLFLALCRRYGLKPYRYYRQRRNTVMIRAPKRGVVVLLGVVMIVAAIEHDPGEAAGLDGLLKRLLDEPYGKVVVGFVALGLGAFGLYSLARAFVNREHARYTS